jgi:hypothetical protein
MSSPLIGRIRACCAVSPVRLPELADQDTVLFTPTGVPAR